MDLLDAKLDANRAIHRKSVEAIDNVYLLEMLKNIWNSAVSYQLFAAIGNVDLAKSLGDHIESVEAIETGDNTVALETDIDHVTDGFNLQTEGLKLGE